MPEATAAGAHPNRMSRQRQKTRERLIRAALSVMAVKGVETATINDITEAADVGFGSFYNHFSSKEEILETATLELFDRIGAKIDEAIGPIEDPCLALGTAVRMFVGILISRRDWAQFIIRVSVIPGYKRLGMYARLFRDIHKIKVSNRLAIPDPDITTYAVGGALLFMIVALLEGDLPEEGAGERMAATALRMLGETDARIREITAFPLPDHDLEAL